MSEGQPPGGAVGGGDEAVGGLVVERTAGIVIGEGHAGLCGDIPKVGRLGTQSTVLDGAGSVESACPYAFYEV